MKRLTFTSLCLWLGAALAAQSTIELDIVFPRNETYNPSSLSYNPSNATYNPNNDAPIPLVFALQNATAAATYQYTLWWNVHNVGGDLIAGDFINNVNNASKFNYTSESTATLVDSLSRAHLDAGSYSLGWKIDVAVCSATENSFQLNLTTVSSGTHYFSIANNGIDMAFDGCPEYLGSYTVRSVNKLNPNCAAPQDDDDQPKKRPCSATLSKAQVNCLSSYFRANTSQSDCQAGYELIPPAVNLTWNPTNTTGKPGLGAVYRPDWMAVAVTASMAIGIVFFS